MNGKHVLLLTFALIATASGKTTATAQPTLDHQAESSLQPVYQPVDTYVPHATYPYADTYPNSAYDYLVPAGPMSYPQAGEYMTGLMPKAQTVMQVALKIFAKIGLFLVGGIALLVVGGIFTTAVCSLTPICTISFYPFQDMNRETVRSLVNPDNLSAAANFVQDAIGKYQRLQRAVGNA